ncbi:DUF3383 domain-containing protein [Acidobacteria bacterium AB60]|nr:DUF3383 domain-containing protein [Acidobacteria bacterium AB60]
MTISASLPISSLVSVTATLSAAAVQAQSTQTMLVLVNDPTIDVKTRMQYFTSAAAVAQQCGSNSLAAASATVWFSQVPQPAGLYLGRWAQTASSGQLFGATLTATQQLIATWQAVTSGGFTVTIDGGAAQNITGLNFAALGNLNAVAAAIQAHLTGATIVWNALTGQFVITSATTGAASTVSFATAPGSGTDISAMLGMTAGSIGAYQVSGIVAETALAAMTIFDQEFGQQFYGVAILGAADSDHQAVATFLAASANKHFYAVSTQETGVLVTGNTTNIAYLLQNAATAKCAVQYSGSSAYSAIEMLARILTVDYTGQSTAINLMYKQEPGIAPDTLTANQLAALVSYNCNGFLAYNNGASILQPGICSNGQWIDTVIGTDALVLAIQTAVFNLLYTTPTKIPQTDVGMHQIKVTIEQVLSQFAGNGFIAPGVWTGPLFGALQNNPDGTPPTLSKGYYVYQPPVSSQSSSARQSRISVPFQIAAKLAGAVQTVSVNITLNV